MHEVLEHDHRGQAHDVVVAARPLRVRQRQAERQQHRRHREVGQQLDRREQPLGRPEAGEVAAEAGGRGQQQRVAQRRQQRPRDPGPLAPPMRGDDVEQRRVRRRQHGELEDQRRRDLGGAAQGVGRDREPEVAGVEVAAGHRPDHGLADRPAPQHPDRHVERAHRQRRERGDHQARREHPRHVGAQERDVEQRRGGDEERRARERLGGRVRQQPEPPDEQPDGHDHGDDEEALEHPAHPAITARA